MEAILLEEIYKSVNEKASKLRELALTKRLNFLIGSGASLPGIPLMSDERFSSKDIFPFSDESEKIRNDRLLDEVKKISKTLLEEEDDESLTTKQTLDNYKGFLNAVIDILKSSNARQVPRTANIFTTNYDLFCKHPIARYIKIPS